jgi:hypothetical protein
VGAITPLAGDWNVLHDRLRIAGQVSTVAANFAVLNHLCDLDVAVRRFAPYLSAQGAVVANVLSPFYGPDVLTRWWWGAALRSVGRGAITARGAVVTHRFFPGTIRRAGAPEFQLTELRSCHNDPEPGSLSPVRWPAVVSAQFWLAVWRRRC